MLSSIAAVLTLASEQEGLLTTMQAQRRGISRLELSRLATHDVIERVAHGVYITPEGSMKPHSELRAAWMALDPHTFAYERLDAGSVGFSVTHRSAAELHGLGQLIPDVYEFVSTTPKRTRREDVRIRRRSIGEVDITIVHGLPCTSVERTIADLAESHEDLSLVADALYDAELSVINVERLCTLLDPVAKINDHESGTKFLRFLMRVGGLEKKVVASVLADALDPTGQSTGRQLWHLSSGVNPEPSKDIFLRDLVKGNLPALRSFVNEFSDEPE
ncbi:type IV toxin-antitoxin system AbiEi family antitoxin domain-containing protein [Brevibacterium picturae]|uniref:AbiEi antitoxin N-terminal domain-containing protein n=1 Tax=Brevibacterium picturae TaxID=260553 RepID=A0ABP4MTR3_9MICO